MTIPKKPELSTLDYAWRGSPFCWVDAKASVASTTLDYAWRGAPFVGAPTASGQTFNPAWARGANAIHGTGVPV